MRECRLKPVVGTAPATVSEMSTNRSAPPVTVTPVLIYPDVRAAVAWLESAFGFEERVRIGDAHRAQLRVGSDGAVVVTEARADQVAPSAGVVTHLVKSAYRTSMRPSVVRATLARACRRTKNLGVRRAFRVCSRTSAATAGN